MVQLSALIKRVIHSVSDLSSGQSLIELLLAMAFAGIILPVLLTAFITSREGKPQQQQRVDAVLVMSEMQDALRSIREQDWSQIATNGTYYPAFSGNGWGLISGSKITGDFTKQLIISDGLRDQSGQIVDSGGTVDFAMKKIVLSVSWTKPYASSLSRTMYLSRFLKNTAAYQTTAADFTAGNISSTQITNISGGEVILGPYGKGNWCKPNLSITANDLPKSGVANAISAVYGDVVAGTGDNASGISFANVAVSDTTPPLATVSGTFDGYKTNDVFTDGHYAYLATDNNAKEVVIIDLTQKDQVTGKYVEVGYFNAPGNVDGESIYSATTSASIGFVTTSDNKLYTFNLSSKSGSRPQLASKALSGIGSRVIVVGSYAYVAITGSTQEMQIVQFDPSGTTLTITGYADVNGQAASDVSINPEATRAYLATGADSTKPEFFIVDISAKSGNRPILGSLDAGGMNPKGIAFVSNQRVLLVGAGGEEYQVINIANEVTPVLCGGLDVPSGVNGVAAVSEPDGESYSYIITGDVASELKIIEGGPGGTYVSSGVFTSSVIDLGADVIVNHLGATVTHPFSTDVQFQIAVAKAVNGNCNNSAYLYVGPDGTSSTYFPNSGGAVPMYQGASDYENPGRCVRYKAFLTTTDRDVTPVISDVSINYSL